MRVRITDPYPEQLLVRAAFKAAAVARVPRGAGKAVLNR